MERTISITLAFDLGKLMSLEESIYRVLVFSCSCSHDSLELSNIKQRSNDVGNLRGVPAIEGQVNSVEWISRGDQSSIMNGDLMRKNTYFEMLQATLTYSYTNT